MTAATLPALTAEVDCPLCGRVLCRCWRYADDRACATADDPDMWFSGNPTEQAEAKRICGACPVRAGCLAHALGLDGTAGEPHGVWGGRTPEERRRPEPRPRPVLPSVQERVDAGDVAPTCSAGHRRTNDNTRLGQDRRVLCKTCANHRRKPHKPLKETA